METGNPSNSIKVSLYSSNDTPSLPYYPPNPMNILISLSTVLCLASCTFVSLNDQRVTLRRHYRSILRYTTLHHISKDVRSRINMALSRADPVGDLARTLLDLERKVSDDYRNRLAFSSFYYIVKGMHLKKMRLKAEKIWTNTLHEIDSISPCKHCKQVLGRFFEEQSLGKANVYGSRWGKGRLARQILDKPSLCCFRRKKELRNILRRMELELVKMYVQGLPKRFQKSTLRKVYQQELDVMQKALSTPIKKEEHKTNHHHHIEAHLGNNNVEKNNSDKNSSIHKPKNPSWRSWLTKLKTTIKHRNSCIQNCNEQAKQETKSDQVGEKSDQLGEKSDQVGEAAKSDQPDSNSRQQKQLLQWLHNVKRMLTNKMNRTEEKDNENEHFVMQSSSDKKSPLAGAIIEEEHIIQH